MRYNYKYGILFKFNPSMDVVLNKRFGYMTILELFYNFTREYKKRRTLSTSLFEI